MRRTGNPSIVDADGKHHALSRVEFSDRVVDEGFLQDSLHKSPQILPVEELDPAFAPLVSLGREIESIDNLFISPEGKITLVETKLWRNPEATREVVAQVLDYAAKLRSWSYSDLENAARKALPPAPIGMGTLYEFVAKKCPKKVLPEEQFIDEVQKNLRDARFLLLVVGDGIRENIENMLGHLHKHPQMLFTFCLVEIHIYENPDLFNGRLLMPMLVAHTTEIVRAVVRVQTTGNAQVTVEMDEPNEDKKTAARRTLSMDEFLDMIPDEKVKNFYDELIKNAEELTMVPVRKSASVVLKVRDPKGSGQDFSVLVLDNKGKVCTGHPSWLPRQLKDNGYSQKLADEFYASIYELVPKTVFSGKYSNYVDAKLLEPHFKRLVEIIKRLVSSINKEMKRE